MGTPVDEREQKRAERVEKSFDVWLDHNRSFAFPLANIRRWAVLDGKETWGYHGAALDLFSDALRAKINQYMEDHIQQSVDYFTQQFNREREPRFYARPELEAIASDRANELGYRYESRERFIAFCVGRTWKEPEPELEETVNQAEYNRRVMQFVEEWKLYPLLPHEDTHKAAKQAAENYGYLPDMQERFSYDALAILAGPSKAYNTSALLLSAAPDGQVQPTVVNLPETKKRQPRPHMLYIVSVCHEATEGYLLAVLQARDAREARKLVAADAIRMGYFSEYHIQMVHRVKIGQGKIKYF